MQRITKRNEQGGVDLDGLTFALDKLARYEDTGLEPYQVADYIIFYERFKEANNCNNCAHASTCAHVPSPGDNIRINCFAWEGKEDGQTGSN